jgi:glycosyltransferase involved in cell wall biosynthesis
VSAPLRVAFAFASRGIGGAERSMLRLMGHAHPTLLDCRVIVAARGNVAFREASLAAGVPYHELSPHDLRGWGRLLRRHRPDVLYVFGRFRTLSWALQARWAGVRCIVAAERSAANRWSDRLARGLDRPLVTAYIANSETAARNLRAYVGSSGPPVWVVPNGIEPPSPPAAQPSLSPLSVLCVGNITPNKGQGVLLEAIRLLRPRHPGLRATLLGRDFTSGRFFAQAEARGLADTYVAPGFVDDVRPYLALATVIVLPTLHREGMPTSLLEAMRCGVPVVATRVGGVCEVVEDRRTGLLVTPGDARGLAEAIGRLLEDEEGRRQLAENARRYVEERHDISVMVEGHRAAFRDAVARAAGDRRPRALPPPATVAPAQVAHVTTASVSLRYLLLGQLTALRQRGFPVAGISSAGPDASALGQGIEHLPVPMTRRLTPLQDLLSLVRLYRLMRRRRFTIVHTHNPKPGLLGQLAARLAGVPVVVNTLHGFYFHERMSALARRFYVALERIAARCSDVILSQNAEDVETALRERIARPGQIRLLGNGIDLARFDPARLGPESRRRTRASLGIAEDAPVVGFVGRLVREKGVGELLQAARAVLELVPAVRFLLVGGTDEEKADRLRPEAARLLGIEEACVFAGIRQDMPELYRAMDVFVLPSHREGFPRAPMEASAMKLPCIVTDVRGCRQAVTQDRNGLLVPVGDAAALAEAILALLADPARARRLGEEGRRRALQEFDEHRVFATVLAEYERLLREKGLGARVPPLRPAVLRSRAANR